jgi:hypothetical protein
VILASYTNGGSPLGIAEANGYISPYLDGQYFTGQSIPASIWFTPFTAVIDLETMVVLGRDTFIMPLGTSGIMNHVQAAASD